MRKHWLKSYISSLAKALPEWLLVPASAQTNQTTP